MILDHRGNPIQAEERASFAEPPDWLREVFMGPKTAANEVVNRQTAMTVMAFFACVRNISEDITKMPKKVMQKRGKERVELLNHPVYKLLRRPNDYTDRHSFWATITAHATSRHGGFAEITRDAAGRPVELHLLDPSKITAWTTRAGRIVYRHSELDPNNVFPQESIFHYHGLGNDAIQGYSMLEIARQVLGAAIALQKYRGAFFGNGAQPDGILTHPAALTAEAQTRLQNQFRERHSGASNSHSTIILEEGMSWAPVSIDPERAQLVDLTSVTGLDICRGFRMPPHKVGFLENATFSNIEHQNIEYDTDTLDPWADRLESEIEFKLLRTEELERGVYVHINRNALMRADTATRVQFYKDMYYMGVFSPNDISELEDRNPVPEGDRYVMQQNLVPVDKVDEWLESKKPGTGTSEPAQPTPDDSQNDARMMQALNNILRNTINDLLFTEFKKAQAGTADTEYFDKRVGYVANKVRPHIEAIARAFGFSGDVEQVISDYAEQHCAMSAVDIEAGNHNTWTDGSRAYEWANRILEQLRWNTAA